MNSCQYGSICKHNNSKQCGEVVKFQPECGIAAQYVPVSISDHSNLHRLKIIHVTLQTLQQSAELLVGFLKADPCLSGHGHTQSDLTIFVQGTLLPQMQHDKFLCL